MILYQVHYDTFSTSLACIIWYSAFFLSIFFIIRFGITRILNNAKPYLLSSNHGITLVRKNLFLPWENIKEIASRYQKRNKFLTITTHDLGSYHLHQGLTLSQANLEKELQKQLTAHQNNQEIESLTVYYSLLSTFWYITFLIIMAVASFYFICDEHTKIDNPVYLTATESGLFIKNNFIPWNSIESFSVKKSPCKGHATNVRITLITKKTYDLIPDLEFPASYIANKLYNLKQDHSSNLSTQAS